MNGNELLTEGDVNFSASRKSWYKLLDQKTTQLLEEDADVFLHQSLSTPCLDVLASCEGIYITDVSGKKYMDFHGNNVHQIGYRHPHVIQKVKDQMDVLPFSPRRYTNQVATSLAQKLSAMFPGDLKRVLFAPGGTSAIGMALKLARLITGKTGVVSMVDSFHGASLDAIAVGGEEQFKRHMGKFDTLAFNVPQPGHAQFMDQAEDDLQLTDSLDELLTQNPQVGAFIAETIRNTDVQIPSKIYWQRVREICNKHHVLLILDEIPIAFGRTGKMFAFQHYGIEPDMVCLGKGLGAGVIPIAALVTRDAFNIAGDISLGHYTHEKSPLGSAAGLAMLEVIEKEKLLEKVMEDEIFIRERLEELKIRYPLIGSIRGIGLLWGIELIHNHQKALKEADQIMYECLENGLSFKVSQGNVLQWCPPLIIKRVELEAALDILEKAIQSAMKKQNI